MNFRSPSITVGLSPIIRRDLRHAVQANRSFTLHDSAFDSRQMVLHARTCRTASSLNFQFQANLDFGFGEAVIINRHLRPGVPGCLQSIDNRKTRFDLRHALDCDFIAVISRTLPQSAPATRPCGLLLACSLSGTSDPMQSLFPVRLQSAVKLTPTAPATWLLRRFRPQTCAQDVGLRYSADPLRLQNLQDCASVALLRLPA